MVDLVLLLILVANQSFLFHVCSEILNQLFLENAFPLTDVLVHVQVGTGHNKVAASSKNR